MTKQKDGINLKSSRREFFGLAGSLASHGVFPVSHTPSVNRMQPEVAPEDSSGIIAQSAIPQYVNYPDDPFVIAQGGAPYFFPSAVEGWEASSTTERIRTILSLHPDALAFPTLASFEDGEFPTNAATRLQIRFFKRTGIPASAGWNTNIVNDPNQALQRYGKLMKELAWTYPDGSALENPIEILSEGYNGDTHEIEFAVDTLGIPSVFAQGSLDLLIRATEQRFDQGFAGFFVDGGGAFRINGLDFSIWAQSAFQNYLAELPSETLDEYGIDNPDTFDIRSYLEAEGITPTDQADPRSNPVFREFLLHHHLGVKDFFQSYQRAIKERYSERMEKGHSKLWANQFMGNFDNPQAANVYISDSLDIIHTEMFPAVNPGADFVYKLQRALGRFSKPTMVKGTLVESSKTSESFSRQTSRQMLKRFQVAEASANGGVFKLPLTSTQSESESITNWIQADGTIHEDLQSFNDFVWTHRRFLQQTESIADVAVVWSLPTRLWWHEPQWNIGDDSPRIDSFVGTTRLLREEQIPYDIIVFGHPRLWDDTEQLRRLTRYDAVILPAIDCLSDAQLEALQDYLADDGKVITSGEPPSRTDMFVPSEETASLFNQSGVTVLDDDPGRQRAVDGTNDGSLRDVLAVESITIGESESIAISTFTQQNPSRTLVHLLNYDYTQEDDSFAPKEDIRLRIPTPDHTVGVARFYSEQEIVDLEFDRSTEHIECTIPRVVEWGFLVLGRDSDTLVNASAKQPALSRHQEAKQRLEKARQSGHDWGPQWAMAETHLEAASAAIKNEAYALAEETASAAIEAVDETFPRPVIGFDLAHNQPESLNDQTPFSWFEDQFPDYRYTTITDWDEQSLDDIDVLVIPPALAFRKQSYNFGSDELDSIEKFVTEGGSLIVLARGGVARDIDDLTEQFGYRFQGQPIVFPDGTAPEVHPSQNQPLTEGVWSVHASLATPIKRRPEDATVLARLPEDSPAWMHKDEPLNERSTEEESAAGKSIMVYSSHEEGEIVLLGTHTHFVSPERTPSPDPVVENLLWYLGQNAMSQQPENETTPSATISTKTMSSATASPSQSDSTVSPTMTVQLDLSWLVSGVGIMTGIFAFWWKRIRDE